MVELIYRDRYGERVVFEAAVLIYGDVCDAGHRRPVLTYRKHIYAGK